MIQYMACGLPVLASAVGANVDIFFASHSGLLVEPGQDWGQALMTLLASRDRFRAMGIAGRSHAIAHYSVRAVIDSYVGIFNSLAR